jgi:hypothetical protein
MGGMYGHVIFVASCRSFVASEFHIFMKEARDSGSSKRY